LTYRHVFGLRCSLSHGRLPLLCHCDWQPHTPIRGCRIYAARSASHGATAGDRGSDVFCSAVRVHEARRGGRRGTLWTAGCSDPRLPWVPQLVALVSTPVALVSARSVRATELRSCAQRKTKARPTGHTVRPHSMHAPHRPQRTVCPRASHTPTRPNTPTRTQTSAHTPNALGAREGAGARENAHEAPRGVPHVLNAPSGSTTLRSPCRRTCSSGPSPASPASCHASFRLACAPRAARIPCLRVHGSVRLSAWPYRRVCSCALIYAGTWRVYVAGA
jgi:hypothetical protein